MKDQICVKKQSIGVTVVEYTNSNNPVQTQEYNECLQSGGGTFP